MYIVILKTIQYLIISFFSFPNQPSYVLIFSHLIQKSSFNFISIYYDCFLFYQFLWILHYFLPSYIGFNFSLYLAYMVDALIIDLDIYFLFLLPRVYLVSRSCLVQGAMTHKSRYAQLSFILSLPCRFVCFFAGLTWVSHAPI